MREEGGSGFGGVNGVKPVLNIKGGLGWVIGPRFGWVVFVFGLKDLDCWIINRSVWFVVK